MAPPFIRFLLGVASMVGGTMMALNPAPPGSRRMQSLPVTGVMVVAGGIWIIVVALRGDGDAKAKEYGRHASGNPPRHAAKEGRAPKIRLWVGLAVAIPASCSLLWWGLDSGYLSLVGLGVSCLGFTVLALVSLIMYPDLR